MSPQSSPRPADNLPQLSPIQRPQVALAFVVAVAIEIYLLRQGGNPAALFPVGLAMGLALYHAAFGFTAAYRNAIVKRDITGVCAQLIMLGVAMVLFAPVLANGEIFGHAVSGAVAPVSVSMALGALVFGIGMQMAGGCGSGTLFTVGGGNIRMGVVLLFFCIGGFWGSLDLHLWQQLPGIGAVSLGRELGWGWALALQLALLIAIYRALKSLGGSHGARLWPEPGFRLGNLIQGPWPLLLSALLLAFFNWLTLVIAGHPWSVTWAFTLWAAKGLVLVGWDPMTSGFWTGGFQERALNRSVFMDVTSVMNFGIIIGAFLAASLAGKMAPSRRIPVRSLVAAVLGGLMLGYGARLGYGCNIGAFFSGTASTSLHGWVWIASAVAGNIIGVKVRPFFHLQN